MKKNILKTNKMDNIIFQPYLSETTHIILQIAAIIIVVAALVKVIKDTFKNL